MSSLFEFIIKDDIYFTFVIILFFNVFGDNDFHSDPITAGDHFASFLIKVCNLSIIQQTYIMLKVRKMLDKDIYTQPTGTNLGVIVIGCFRCHDGRLTN